MAERPLLGAVSVDLDGIPHYHHIHGLAPLAEERGLGLRIAFEHLAPEILDDPEPFEPDADDLAAIEHDVRREVAAIRGTTEFAGVADREVCVRCRYRSICPDSATPGVPVWPTVDSEDDA